MSSKYLFPYKWFLKNGFPSKNIKYHGKKVFGTFVCGGGSTMGYKLAGFEHLGGVEIDPKVGEVYELNHKPKHFYLEDIRLFNKREDLPKELFDLDLLDGSPPCSSFSMAGNREKDWGKKKVFREGQSEQVLDDLVFEYIKTIKKLKPKVALLENVKGLIQGNAKFYAKKIKKDFEKSGYRVQLFLLNAASMGVPQKRERVFFIGLRNDISLPKLKLEFNEKQILFGEFGKSEKHSRIKSEARFGDVMLFDNKVSNTITSNGDYFYKSITQRPTKESILNVGTYPQDYKFGKNNYGYLIGMSVPPVMTAQISNQIYLQWLSKT